MTKNPVIHYLFLLLNARYECAKTPKYKRRGLKQWLKRKFTQAFYSLEFDERVAVHSLKQDDELEHWITYKNNWCRINPNDQELFDQVESDRFVFQSPGRRYDPKIVFLIMSQRYCPKNDLPSVTGADKAVCTKTGIIVVPKEAFIDFPTWFKVLRNKFLSGAI